MADAKKYYYMRLNEGYFNSDEQILLESMPEGYLYSNILLKLYLKSLRRDGLLMFNERIPYNADMIATITRHHVGTVEKAMRIFQQLGIVEILDSGAIYMLDVQNYVGKTSTEADRIRAYRNKIETEKNAVKSLPDTDCTNVQDDLYICTPEKEIEIETKKEINKKKERKTAPRETALALYERLLPHYCVPDNLQAKMAEWITYKTERKEKYTETGMKSLLRKVEDNQHTYGCEAVCNLIDDCMANNWAGIIFDKLKSKPAKPSNQNQYQKPTKAAEMDDFYNMAAQWAESEE